MKHSMQFVTAGMIAICLLLTSGLFAQDAAKVDPKHYKVEFENDQVRVLRITYGPGEKSVMHAHPAGVAVFLTDMQGKFTYPDGKTEETAAKPGQVVWLPALKHQPENTGEAFELIQVEMKSTSEGTNGAALRKTIEAQSAKFTAAYNRQDAAGLAALYMEDARALPPNREMVQGRKAIADVFAEDFKMGAHDLKLTTVDVSAAGNTAYEIGTYTIKIKPEGQEAFGDKGKYLAVWKRQTDGTYLMHWDTWNSDMPMPGQ